MSTAIQIVLAAALTSILIGPPTASGTKAIQLEYDLIVKLISDIQEHYSISSVFMIYANEESMRAITLMLNVIREFSKKFVFATALNFIQVCNGHNEYSRRILKPLFVTVLSNKKDIHLFERMTHNYVMSSAMWLVIFLRPLNYCPTPRRNYFHVTFDTEMMVKCYNDSTIWEWYSLDGVKVIVKKLATWNGTERFKLIDTKSFYERRTDLSAKTLRITTVRDSPFITGQEGLKQEGFFARILSELEHKLNFTKTVINKYDPYGCLDSDTGEWTGAIGRLTKGEADLGMADFTMTKERLEAIDFTHPVLLSHNYLYMRQPEGSALQWFSYFRVFDTRVWIAIKLLYTFSFFIIALMGTVLKEKPRPPNHTSETYLGVWGILWQQALPSFPSSSPLRMAYFSLFMSAVILLATYSGSLTSYVAVTVPTLPFSDFAGFAEDGSYKMTAIQQSNDYDIFVNSTDVILRKMHRLMVDPIDQPRTLMDGFNKACQYNYAFYSTEAVKTQISAGIPCDLVYVKSGTMDSLGITLTKNSQYRRMVNYHLVKLRNFGIMERLRLASYKRVNHPENKFQPVNIYAVFSIFLILGMGMILSIFILILEKTTHHVRIARQTPKFGVEKLADVTKTSKIYGEKLININMKL